MTASPTRLREELAAALRAADQAERIIRRYYDAGVAVKRKADRTPVTKADVESERAIREILADCFPKDGFFGEETGQSAMEATRLWLVDPIDGTKSFIRDTPFFSTQIALRIGGRLEMGVSNAPLFGERAWAVRGDGAWLNDRAVEVSDISSLSQATLSTGNLGSAAGDERWARLGEVVAEVDKIRGYGDFYHYHLLAKGSIDAVVESDLNILDVAALCVLVEAAGGRVTTWSGDPVGLDATSVIASNGHLHDELLRRLNG